MKVWRGSLMHVLWVVLVRLCPWYSNCVLCKLWWRKASRSDRFTDRLQFQYWMELRLFVSCCCTLCVLEHCCRCASGVIQVPLSP